MYTGTSRSAVILGCAKCVWSDYDKVLAVKDQKDLVHFAVNDIGIQFTSHPVEHIVSLHSDILGALKKIHSVRFSQSVCTHGWKNDDGVDFAWYGKITNIGGTSSLFATEIALELGFRDIYICGVPLDDTPHYYEDNRKEKSDIFSFCRVPENRAWDKLFNKDYKFNIHVASGVLQTMFGGIDG